MRATKPEHSFLDEILSLGKFKLEVPPNQELDNAGVKRVLNVLYEEYIKGEVGNPIYFPYEADVDAAEWEWGWLVTRGKYAGTLPKRIASWYWKNHHIRLSSDLLGKVGSVAKEHISGQPTTLWLDVTDDFDWYDGAFGDSGSCYWGENNEARNMLDSAKAFAIRQWTENWYKGLGRVWGVPYNNGGFVLYNSYGPLRLVRMARIIATHIGASYARVSLCNRGAFQGTLWINGGVGYFVDTANEIEDIHSIDLGIHKHNSTRYANEDEVECVHCGSFVDRDDAYQIGVRWYCDSCICWCSGCDEYVFEDNYSGDGLCNNCWNDKYFTCTKCNETTSKDNMCVGDDDAYCESCWGNWFFVCDVCNETFNLDECKAGDYVNYCPDCWDEVYFTCDECEEDYKLEHKDQHVCEDCETTLREEQEDGTSKPATVTA